ncbi:MAG: DUF167 domain-containing protein [Coriobacteriia bacterium]|nr:DUF167 domain-containing protein [Coriobacteriia bacterium]
MARLAVHVTPRAGRDEVVGWRGSELSVRVTSAPEGGKANAAVVKVIASAMAVPKTSVSVVRGEAARHKVLDIANASDHDVAAVFGRSDESLF